jgi:hypothetical protein
MLPRWDLGPFDEMKTHASFVIQADYWNSTSEFYNDADLTADVIDSQGNIVWSGAIGQADLSHLGGGRLSGNIPRQAFAVGTPDTERFLDAAICAEGPVTCTLRVSKGSQELAVIPGIQMPPVVYTVIVPDCADCPRSGIVAPSPIFTNDIFEPPVPFELRFIYCVTAELLTKGNFDVVVQERHDTLGPKVLGSKVVPLPPDAALGECRNGVANFELICGFEGDPKLVGGLSARQVSPRLELLIDGVKIAEVQTFGCG